MEKLIEKLNDEYNRFLNGIDVLNYTPREVVSKFSYQAVTKNAIIEYLEDLNLGDELINYMMSIDGLLNQFYSDWLSFDGRLYDGSLEASVDNSIDIIKNEL